MKKKLMNKKLFTFLVVAGLLSVTKSAFATTNTDEALIQKMGAQTAALESQMKGLKTEVRELKAEQQSLQSQVKVEKVSVKRNIKTKTGATPVKVMEPTQPAPGLPSAVVVTPTKTPPVTYLSGTPVVIAPYLGNHTTFSPFDLVVNYSNYNEDLRLLQLRQDVFNRYKAHDVSEPAGPMLMLSGKVEGQAVYQKPYAGSHISQATLSSAELDLIPTINNWAGGYIALKYDNSVLPNTPATSNSRMRADEGFLTFGDLNRLPFYLTVGQFYMPFGAYSSSMITSPITETVFQTRARAFEIGYQQPCNQGLYSEIYAFNGDSSTTHTGNINNVGANVGVNYSNGSAWNIDSSIGAISNVADSLGMQTTGAPVGFGGFSAATPTGTNAEILQRQVPGIAAHVNFGIGKFGLATEYVAATSPFATQNMTFNGYGARPETFYTEGSYNFHIKNHPSAFLLGYGRSWQALAVSVPEARYEASFLTSVWKDTLQQIEFRHDTNYQLGDTASGAGVAMPTSAIGGSSNTVTMLLGIYF